MASSSGMCDGDGRVLEKTNKVKSASTANTVSVTDHRQVAPDSKENCSLLDLFSRFESFNFDEDQHFQVGLSKISSLLHPSRENDLLKIKAFYYSKNVEPFDWVAYVKWNHKQRTNPDSSKASEELHTFPEGDGRIRYEPSKNSTVPSSAEPAAEESSASNNGHAVSSQLKTDVENKPCSSVSSNSSDKQELSFAEIAELIQRGKPVPGLTALEVLPSNEDPSPSQLPRAKKPWEE